MNETQKDFWASIELFGHSRLAGKVSEYQLGGTSFVRVSVPETKHHPAHDKLLNHAAIYAITPVDENISRALAERISAKPLDSYELSGMLEKKLKNDDLMIVKRQLDAFDTTEVKPDIPEGDDFDDTEENEF